jgi:hypothetical protein
LPPGTIEEPIRNLLNRETKVGDRNPRKRL